MAKRRASADIHRIDTAEHWAVEYVKRGWALTQLHYHTQTDPERAKRPLLTRWQAPERWVHTADAARAAFARSSAAFGASYVYNIGLVHQGSRTLAVDVDHLELARTFFAAAGLDLDRLLASTARIVRDQDPRAPYQRAKALFELPPDLDAPGLATVTCAGDDGAVVTVLELRSGKGRQDVLPPSVHPSGAVLRWEGYDVPGVVTAPPELLALYGAMKAVAHDLGNGWRAAVKSERGPLADAAATPHQPSLLDELTARLYPTCADVLSASELYEERGGRWRPLGSTSAAGITLFDDGRVWSHHVSDPMHRGFEPKPLSLFELYVRLFHHDPETRPQDWFRAAQVALTRPTEPDDADAAPAAVETIDEPSPPSAEAHGLALAFDRPVELNPWLWPELVDNVRRGKQDYVLPTERNARIILAYHPQLAGVFRFDEFTDACYVVNAPYDDEPCVRPCDLELEPHSLLGWLQNTPEFKDLRGTELFGKAIRKIAEQSFRVDSLTTTLRNLPEWDRRPRLDTWLADYASIPDTPLARTLGRRFLIGLVSRALLPGCQLDTVPVLEGAQGTFKSTLGAVIAGTLDLGPGARFALHTSKHLDLRFSDDRAVESIQRTWLFEHSELSTMNNASLELLKNFIARRSDHYRTPYARNATTKPRRIAWYATTNETSYLKDSTGNRRFWPLRIERSIDIDAIARDRDQLLAEAITAFDANERWWVGETDPLHDALEAEQNARESWSGRFDTLVKELPKVVAAQLAAAPADFYELHKLDEHPPTHAQFLNSELLRIADVEPSHATATALGAFMRRELGWHRVFVKVSGVKTWPRGFSPSEAWLDANDLRWRAEEPVRKGKKKR